jgi:hypothetical protein
MSPANPDMNRSAGPVLDTSNIAQAPETGKNMADLTPEEFQSVAAEDRGYNRRLPLRYDPREFQGRYFWERGFLSTVIAGGGIPTAITPNLFTVPWNRVIFQAAQELEKLDMSGADVFITLLRETGTLEKAGGEDYVREIEGMVGIPSAVQSFTIGLLRLNLGAKI